MKETCKQECNNKQEQGQKTNKIEKLLQATPDVKSGKNLKRL